LTRSPAAGAVTGKPGSAEGRPALLQSAARCVNPPAGGGGPPDRADPAQDPASRGGQGRTPGACPSAGKRISWITATGARAPPWPVPTWPGS